MTSDSTSPPGEQRPNPAVWRDLIKEYEEPSTWRATWQIVDTLGPYGFLWWLMYRSLDGPLWVTLLIAALSGTLLIRVFIIFHDCGHGSFFRSRAANAIVGFIAGMLTFTPSYHWRWQHALHHGTAGNLDQRGLGDVWTLTVQEYLESSRWKRFAYRLARNPIVLFVIAPLFIFVVRQRWPSATATLRERHSVWWMNIAVLGMAIAMSLIFGFTTYLFIQMTAMMVAGSAGVWLFYIQHQFEDAYWERQEDWDFTRAALQGSSFYRLPAPLRWFSGNIGYHHVHHLSSRIANYNLKRCHDSHPYFQQVAPITLRSSLRSARVQVWDEKLRKLVSIMSLRARKPGRAGDRQDLK